jgi:CHAT domain-containing protein
MRWLAVFLLLCGCSLKPRERLETLFDSARDSLQAGDLDKAQGVADHGLQLAGERRDASFQWRFRLLRAEIMINNKRAEEVLDQLAEPVPAAPAFAALAARKKMLEGQAQSILGHAELANTLLEEAHAAAQAAGAAAELLDIENIQGPVLLQLHRPDLAERVLQTAQARARGLHSPYAEGSVLVNLGFTRLRNHRYDEAVPYFERASQVAGPGLSVLYSAARNNLAVCYFNLGDPDRAIEIDREAIARNERSGSKHYLQQALGGAGEAYLSIGELQQAVPYLLRALSLASELGRVNDSAVWAGNLSSVYIELGDWRHADTFNQEAIRLKKLAKNHTLYYNTLYAAAIAAGKGDLDQAAMLYQQAMAESDREPAVLWEGHGGLAMLETKRGRADAAAHEFEAAIGVIEETRADLLRTEFKLPFLTRRIRVYQQYVDALIAQGQVERALAVADASRAQVLAERYGSAPAHRLPPGAFQDLARKSGAVLVSYWLAPARSHVWVVTPKEIHHAVLPAAAEIEPHVAAYRQAVERLLADPMRTRLPAGEKLYQVLLAPLREWIPAKARVVLVPDGVLHGLNLETLPLPGEPARYWIQDVTLEIAPSLALWGAPSGTHAAARRLLLLGNPVVNDPDFPPLAHAAAEIESVRRSFAPSDQVVLTRDSATPQAYLAAAAGPFAAIHFTAHAVANRADPLESAVLLSGGKLYARDAMGLKLDADLVTVSSCRGAGSRTYSGEGLVGFVWAFLRAGARHVVAGLWDVNDQSTAGLMDVLYRELAAGRRPADALRAAKLAMIESHGNLRKPYYWAPFQLYTVAP